MTTQHCYKAAKGEVKGGFCSTWCCFTDGVTKSYMAANLFNDITGTYPGRPLHGVGKTRVHNVLLRGTLYDKHITSQQRINMT